MTTDTTFSQLSELTGVNTDYIKDSFIPKLKELEDKGYRVETIQQQERLEGIFIIYPILLRISGLYGQSYSVTAL